MLVLTSNRGLCGGYNGGVLRAATARLRELQAAGVAFDLEVAGKRGISFMKFQGYPLAHAYTHFEDRPSFGEVNALAERYVEDFTSGRIDRLDVAWMEFKSASRQFPRESRVLLYLGFLVLSTTVLAWAQITHPASNLPAAFAANAFGDVGIPLAAWLIIRRPMTRREAVEAALPTEAAAFEIGDREAPPEFSP